MCLLRVAGVTHPSFQAAAHVWVGFMAGLAWMSHVYARRGVQEWTDVQALWMLFWVMCITEVLVFLIDRFG